MPTLRTLTTLLDTSLAAVSAPIHATDLQDAVYSLFGYRPTSVISADQDADNACTQDDEVILADDDAHGAQLDIYLSKPVDTRIGKVITVVKIGSTANVVVDGNGSNINGAGTRTLAAQWAGETYIYKGGSNWVIIGNTP